MKKQIKELENFLSEENSDDVIGTLRVKFPDHIVKERVSQAYPDGEKGDNVPKYNMSEVKKAYQVWEDYVKMVKKLPRDDKKVKNHLVLLNKVTNAFKKLLKSKSIRDFVNLNASLSRAAESLY